MTLTLTNISKSYKATKALTDFSVTMTPGIYALLGPNGSGKSTLMNIITDNLRADSGEITYTDDSGNTENVLKMGVRFREKLGFMPQYPGMYPDFTVERFMWYMAALKGLDKKTAEEEIYEILSETELSDSLRTKIKALSGGMKQRLALSQAVLGDPEIIILDEPTAGLDPKQRIAVRNFISRIALSRIVIIATHVVSDIEFIAKDCIILKKGQIIDFASPQELTKKVTGHVFELRCSQSELPDMQNRYQVTNISPDADGVILRIISEEPAAGAVLVNPTLEDYYLRVFGEKSNGGEN